MEKTTALSRLLASIILVLLVVGLGAYFIPKFSDVLAGNPIRWNMSFFEESAAQTPFAEQSALQQRYVKTLQHNIQTVLARVIGCNDIQVNVQAQVSLTETTGRQTPTRLINRTLGQNIQSQSVVVLINGQTKSKENAIYRPLTKAQLAKYTEIVKAIVGFDPGRGDQVLVQDQMFIQESAYPFSSRVGSIVLLLALFGLILWLIISFIIPVLREMICGEGNRSLDQPVFGKVKMLCQKDPEQAASVLKRWIYRVGKAHPRSYSWIDRAGVVVLAVGTPVAALLFRYLNRSEIYAIMKDIQHLGMIAPSDIRQTLHLFLREFYMPSRLVGSETEVKELSQTIVGGDGLYAEVKTSGNYATLWDKMNAMDPEVLAAFFRTLSPDQMAMILLHLSDRVSGKILTYLPETIQQKVLMHLSHIRRIRPKMRNNLIGQLAHDLDLFMHHQPTGADKITAILKTLSETEQEKLKGIYSQKQLQSWSDIIQLPPRKKVTLLKYIDKGVLALALMMSTPEEKQQFAQLLSPTQWHSVCEYMNAQGDVEQARQIMIKTAQELFG